MIIDADRISQCALLSESQRECLRMVRDLHTSKEIAIRLGISPHTVDARLRRIIEKLGVSTRAEAAKMFTQFEMQYQPLIYQPPVLDEMAGPDDKSASTAYPDIEYPTSDQFEHGLYEIRDSCVESSRDAISKWANTSGSDRVAGVMVWDSINRLGITQRIVLIILIAILSASSFGGLISGVVALQSIVP